MASGDTLATFTPLHNEPPAANAATIDTNNSRPVLDFDDGGGEIAIFSGILPRNYAGGGITVTLEWAMSTADATGNVIIATSFERLETGVLDITSDNFAAETTSAATLVPALGLTKKIANAHTDGAQIDSLAVGETFRLKVVGDDSTAAGDMELVAVELTET